MCVFGIDKRQAKTACNLSVAPFNKQFDVLLHADKGNFQVQTKAQSRSQDD